MSQDQLKQSLPFLIRDMLNFEEGTAFSLIVESRSDATNRVRISGATKSGPFTLQHTPTNDKVLKTETFRLPDMPIFLTVDTVAGNYTRGDCYVALNLGINGDKVYKLCAGYIYAEIGITWPTANIEKPTDGIGLFDTVVGAGPAAGAEAFIDVPSGEAWKVHSIWVQLTAAALAASRRVHITIDDGDGTPINLLAPVDQIISETKQYSFYPGVAFGATTNDNDIVAPLPIGLIIPQVTRISTATLALQGTDQFTALQARVEKFYTPI